MNIFIGMDDTDNLESRGTGRLARGIAAQLAQEYTLLGVVRHQLLKDPRVPCTKNNSTATILLAGKETSDLVPLFERIRALMLADFQPGSDPGLCVAARVPEQVIAFGWKAKNQLVKQQEALEIAKAHAILLECLGGTCDGVIGALSSVGLSFCGEDGRYVEVGGLRALSGLQPISALLEAGIASVQTLDGEAVQQGLVRTDKLRPARRGGRAVAFVTRGEECWEPVKLD